ncbi:MAG: class I SAM-dependent methyltransferase [Phycisphaerales bacterium]|nr:class I SAM-dependent methyltransferase [Phycisphaerales bacterium]
MAPTTSSAPQSQVSCGPAHHSAHPGPEGVDPDNFHRIYAGEQARVGGDSGGQARAGSGDLGARPAPAWTSAKVPAPWAIGRPQRAIAELAARDFFEGPVLDIGCGTGENAILLAHRGLEVVGVDLVPKAVEMAKANAARAVASGAAAGDASMRMAPEFRVGSALDLPACTGGRTFRTLLDCAVLHVFSDADRERYRESVTAVAEPGARIVVLVFSEHETRAGGPRRMSVRDIERTLGPRWSLVRVQPARYEHISHDGGARSWLAVLRHRVG